MQPAALLEAMQYVLTCCVGQHWPPLGGSRQRQTHLSVEADAIVSLLRPSARNLPESKDLSLIRFEESTNACVRAELW